MPSLSTIAQGSERPVLTVIWCHADNTTGEDLTGATITGYIKNLDTGDVVEIQGTFAITDAANGVFTWTPDPADVAEDGAYQVQFSAVFGSEPTPARTAVFEWEIVESIIPTDAPTELPDYQGVVKLLARTTDPDAAPTGYYGLFVKDGALWLIDDAGALTAFDDGSIAAAAAVAAHVALADPHPGYLTATEGNAAYAPIAHNHMGVYAEASHTHAVTDVTDLGEYVQDTAAAMITGATHTNVTVAYDDTAGTLAFTAGATYTDEMAQDAAAALFTTATHDGVSVSYNDAGATLAITNSDKGSSAVTTHLAASNPHPEYLTQAEGDALYAPISATQYTDEMAQDATAAALAAGTHTAITVTYDDAGNAISLANTDTGGAAVSSHLAASNPHPEYLTLAEGNVAFAPITVTQYTTEMAQDAAASMLTSATHTGVSVAYTDASNVLAITNTDGGAAAVATHVGLADPHTQYLLESNANYVDLTDGGSTNLHGHAVAWTDITDKPSIYQSTLFLHNTAADVATYKQALTVPSAAAETNVTALASSGTGEVLLAAFITSPMGVSVINGNAWNFQTYAKVDSATGVSQIVVRVYKRDTVGTETELFNTSSAEINVTVATLFEIETVQSSFNVLPSDRMVIKYFAKSTSGSNRTLTLYFQGAENASHAATPVLFASLTVATDTIWDAKGDIAIGTANDTAAVLSVGASNGMVLTVASGEATGVKWAAPVRYIALGSSGTLTAGVKTMRLYVPFACTITNVAASVGTDPTGASVVVDVLKNGTTLWGTNPGNRPTITATNFADLTNTPDTTAISAGDYLTLTVASVGSTVAGADLNVVITVTVA
jgi:hypothetical protein